MPSDHTRNAILAAAERLYADRGFGDVTLRDIVAEANVNLAAVNYHFGSKDELIAELFVTRSIALNRERLTAKFQTVSDVTDANASLSTLAVETGLSKSSVQAALRHLRKRGFVATKRASATAVPVHMVLAPWRR